MALLRPAEMTLCAIRATRVNADEFFAVTIEDADGARRIRIPTDSFGRSAEESCDLPAALSRLLTDGTIALRV